MPNTTPHAPHLSRRERQIMDALYRRGRATAAEVRAGIPDPPGYSSVRTMLRILEEKGHVRHEQDGPRYLYVPRVGRERAKRTALRHLLHTYFEGSTVQAVAALLDGRASEITDADAARLTKLIEKASREGR